MSSPTDAALETAMLRLYDEEWDIGSGRNERDSEQADIASDLEAIGKLAAMADRLTKMVQEIRNTNVETECRLRQVEADLKLIALESRNG